MSDGLGPVVLRVMVLTMLADGDLDDDEVAMVRRTHERLVGTPLSVDDVRNEIVRAQAGAAGVAEFVGERAADLDAAGKRTVLQAAFSVATADGFVLEEEDELMWTLGRALGLGEDELRTVMAELTHG